MSIRGPSHAPDTRARAAAIKDPPSVHTFTRGDRETFIAGHIRQAPVGVAGPIVVPLFVAPSPPTSARHIKQRGPATPNAGTTGADLCETPSAYYGNYHTTAFPGGAIRGQLH